MQAPLAGGFNVTVFPVTGGTDGTGVSDGRGVDVGDGGTVAVGVGVGVGDGRGVADGVAVGDGRGVVDGVTDGIGVALGTGVGVLPAQSSPVGQLLEFKLKDLKPSPQLLKNTRRPRTTKILEIL